MYPKSQAKKCTVQPLNGGMNNLHTNGGMLRESPPHALLMLIHREKANKIFPFKNIF